MVPTGRRGIPEPDQVIPFPVPSSLAATFLAEKKIQADLVHIDAAHEYPDVVIDIDMWYPLVREGGTLLGDDFSNAWPGVVRAWPTGLFTLCGGVRWLAGWDPGLHITGPGRCGRGVGRAGLRAAEMHDP